MRKGYLGYAMGEKHLSLHETYDPKYMIRNKYIQITNLYIQLSLAVCILREIGGGNNGGCYCNDYHFQGSDNFKRV